MPPVKARSVDDGRETAGPVVAVTREAADAQAIPAHNQPVAVVLDFMNPERAGRGLATFDGDTVCGSARWTLQDHGRTWATALRSSTAGLSSGEQVGAGLREPDESCRSRAVPASRAIARSRPALYSLQTHTTKRPCAVNAVCRDRHRLAADLADLVIVAVSSPHLFKGLIELGQAALRAPAARVP